jgi:hypothetical protein
MMLGKLNTSYGYLHIHTNITARTYGKIRFNKQRLPFCFPSFGLLKCYSLHDHVRFLLVMLPFTNKISNLYNAG